MGLWCKRSLSDDLNSNLLISLGMWIKVSAGLIDFFNYYTKHWIWLDSTWCDSNNKTIFAPDPCTLNVLPWKHLSLYPRFVPLNMSGYIRPVCFNSSRGRDWGAIGKQVWCSHSLEQYVYENSLPANNVSSWLKQPFDVAPKLRSTIHLWQVSKHTTIQS